ncbi:MAG: hypothetical protein LBU73_06330 [Helicobacteraceae bacterium]|jgi:hypothetical protein|nr:hypothetical protein [Helicobacteraceae bacterium]
MGLVELVLVVLFFTALFGGINAVAKVIFIGTPLLIAFIVFYLFVGSVFNQK